MIIIVYDGTGTKQDTAWLRANYGNVQVTAQGGATYGEVVLLENVGGAATLVVTCLDANHEPLPGREVRFGWPDGQVIGKTNAAGAVGFGMGGGAYYPLGGTGPHYVRAGGVTVTGLGFKWGSNHHHLDVVLVEGVPEPPSPSPAPGPSFSPSASSSPSASPSPSPEPENYWAELLWRLDVIIDLLEQLRDAD